MKAGAPLLYALMLLSPAALAQPPSEGDALRPYLRELARPIETYHCASLARIGLKAPETTLRPSQLGLFLKSKLDRFRNAGLPTRKYSIVSGLFAGIDPVTCRHFAGVSPNWAIVRIRLPRGLRFLDVRRERREKNQKPRFPQAVLERIQRAGCAATNPSWLVISRESRVCRDIALASLKELRVGAILADHPAFAFERCPESGNGVFILLDADQVRLQEAVLFTREIPLRDAASSERLRIQDLYRRARAEGSSRSVPWPGLTESVGAPQMDLWMDRHLWGCGPPAIMGSSP